MMRGDTYDAAFRPSCQYEDLTGRNQCRARATGRFWGFLIILDQQDINRILHLFFFLAVTMGISLKFAMGRHFKRKIPLGDPLVLSIRTISARHFCCAPFEHAVRGLRRIRWSRTTMSSPANRQSTERILHGEHSMGPLALGAVQLCTIFLI